MIAGRPAMNASSSAIDSSSSLLPATPTAEPHEMTKRTLRVIVLDFARPEQRALSTTTTAGNEACPGFLIHDLQ